MKSCAKRDRSSTRPGEITLEKLRRKIKRLGLTKKDIRDAVRWARSTDGMKIRVSPVAHKL